MARKKLPFWIRYIGYIAKCIWYYVLFPIGAEEDRVMKDLKSK